MKLKKKIVYYDNGDIDYECFVDEQGRWQGESKGYYFNGNLFWIGFHKDSDRHGKFTWYNKDGSLDKIVYYWEGREISKTEFVFRSKIEGSK